MTTEYPCCEHCRRNQHLLGSRDRHSSACRRCDVKDPYLEEAGANPERRNNGCLIYKVGSK